MNLFKKKNLDWKSYPIISLRRFNGWGDPNIWAKQSNKHYDSKVKAEILFRLPIRELMQSMSWCGRDIKTKLDGTCKSNFWLNNDRRFDCYFPNIYKQSPDGLFLSLCPRTGRWLNMPPLDFLPNKVQKLLAGAGGLLLMQGGIEVWRPQAPEFSNSTSLPALWKPLDTLIVVNPLHSPLHTVLPPMPELLDYKLGYIEVKTAASAGYVVHVVGWDQKRDHIVVATYDRNSPSPYLWTKWCSQYVNLRPDTQDKTSLTLYNNRLFLGGERKEPLIQAWVPAILIFDHTTNVWSSVEWDNLHYEAPRVMGTNGQVYVVTRTKLLSSEPKIVQKMVIYRINLDSLQSKTKVPDILEIAAMPTKSYKALFKTKELGMLARHAESAPAENVRCQWQCRAGLGIICFHAHKWHSRLVLYAVASKQWSFTSAFQHFGEETTLANCVWNPNFAALAL